MIDLSDGLLRGTIPSTLGNLPMLQRINLSSNQIVGSLPPELFYTTSLLQLDLDGANNDHGTNSTLKKGKASLMMLNLPNNQLTGTIPSEIGLASNLAWVEFDTNFLTGTLPTTLELLSPVIAFRKCLYFAGI
jgi:hypothetical protein